MRAYLSVTPQELTEFLNKGTLNFPSAFALTPTFLEQNDDEDEEELEFELSWLAAQESRSRQGSSEALGFVLAVDLNDDQLGEEADNQVKLLSEISWRQVESALIAESDETELTWFASQEIPTYLPRWLA